MKQYISLIVHDFFYLFILKKEANKYEPVICEQVPLENAGIIDGHLGNPSFFAYVLYNFFEKHAVKNSQISLLISCGEAVDRVQYLLYSEYFKIPLVHIISKPINTHEACIDTYALHACELWQGE